MEATKTRAIWAHLVNRYILSKPYPPRLERSIDTYTSGELEHILSVWTSAAIGWERDDGHPARERSFSSELVKFAHLIKGGRWLLITTVTGAVTYYDLDAETDTGTLLIQEQTSKLHSTPEIKMSVDDHTNSPLLSFNIAFSLYEGSKAHGHNATLRIWGVELVLDETQHGVGLHATQLATFPWRPAVRYILGLSLLGPTIAFNATHNEDRKAYLFVVEWEQANGSSSTYPWRVLHPIDHFVSVPLYFETNLSHREWYTSRLCTFYTAIEFLLLLKVV